MPKIFLCKFMFSFISIYFIFDSRIIIMYVIVEDFPRFVNKLVNRYVNIYNKICIVVI